jgi:predicted nucleic acid-binding protein
VTLVLDAGVLIGLLNPADVHHAAAAAVFADPDQRFLVHTLNLAEALVGPERARRGLEVFDDLRRLGVEPVSLGSNEALLLAHARAEYRLRMPDTCALATALHFGAQLVTYDDQVRSVTARLGILHGAQ